MGQSNVWYRFESDGREKNAPWLQDIIAYVEGYSDEELVSQPAVELSALAQAYLEEASTGFEQNAAIRSAIEDHAMKLVRRHYQTLGFELKDVHKTKSWDYEFRGEDNALNCVEVKGTRTFGTQVVITPKEVEVATKGQVDLCIVHSVQVLAGKSPRCRGGKLICLRKWNPLGHKLRPISYLCEFNTAMVGM